MPVSAKLALEGKLSGIRELLEKSFLPEFESILNTFLMQEKGDVLLLSVTNNLLRMLSHARLGLELEMKSLLTPLEELKEKLAIFEKKKKEVVIEKEDISLLLDGEIKKIIANVLEEDSTAFRKELYQKISEGVEKRYREYSAMSMKDLRDDLEGQVITEVRQAFDVWRVFEDEKLAKTFEAACKRFIHRFDDTVDSLLKFSAELFAVPFDIVKAEAIWSTKSAFYYRFQEQPVGLEIVTSSLTLLLPKFIGEKIILRKVQDYVHRVINLQTAKVGSDFEERLSKSKLMFRWEMFQRIEATLKGISEAIEKGLDIKDKGEQAFEERKAVLMETEKKMNETRETLIQIRQKVSA